MNELAFYLLLSLLLNISLFAVAFKRQSDKLTDASYALSFITLVIAAGIISGLSLYVLVGMFLVCVWGIRIGGFLLYRVIKTGKDARFDAFRSSFFGFLRFWVLQAITVWVLLIPLFLAFPLTPEGNLPAVSLIGVLVFVIGFSIEAVADAQKWRFSRQKKNKGTWIDTGIWRYSRHPNYFGEILVWIGLYVYAVPVLALPASLVALISPLFIMCLLLFVSGIPLLEKSANERWGTKPAYQQYKRRTSILIPLPLKRDRS